VIGMSINRPSTVVADVFMTDLTDIVRHQTVIIQKLGIALELHMVAGNRTDRADWRDIRTRIIRIYLLDSSG
jgi:hypothetical protein